MLGRFFLARIVCDHVSTFRGYHSRRFDPLEVAFYSLVPLGGAVIMLLMGRVLTDGLATLLVTSLSIFAALLFNLLLLTYDIVRKPDAEAEQLKRTLLRDIYSNISYSILLAIVAVLMLLAHFVFTGSTLLKVVSFVVYFLTFNFVMALLLVLSRVHVLLSKEFGPRQR